MEYKYTDRQGNNFSLIRMIAAYLVILSHATAIQGRGVDIVVRLTGQTHSGQMAVFIFTFLSGIFITKSIINYDLIVFFKRRFLRIYPGLILCLMITLIIGSIFTTLSKLDYWTNSQTWRYFFVNLTEVYNQHILPGVFEFHPIQGLNGVLWYLTFEIRIYLVWMLMKSLRFFDSKTITNIVLLVLLVWIITHPETMPLLGNDSSLLGMAEFPQYTVTFILGALVYVNADSPNLTWKHVMIIGVFMVFFRHSAIATYVWAVGYIIFSIVLGTDRHILQIKVPDLSYGIFLYGWPTGQIVYEIMPNASALIAAIVTAVLATVIAFITERIINNVSAMMQNTFVIKRENNL